VINKVHKEIIKKLKFSKKEQEVEFEGRKFYVFWGKKILKGFDNKQVGTTFYAFDVTNLESEFRSNIARSIIQPMTVMFFLYVIFFLLFSYIKRQSNLHSEKLSGIVNNQSSLIILTNGETIIQSNQSFLKFFDISTVDEFLDNYTCVCEKFEEEEGYLKREYTDKNWLTYIIENPELNHKTKMKDKDGNEHIFQVNARSIKQENKFEYVVSFDDITTLIDVNKNLEKLVMSKTKELRDINSKLEVKIKEAIKENRQKDQQLFQQSRLAQMGEMISMIAHQWRQPLNAISAASMSMNLKAKLNKLDNELAINLTAKISEYSQHLSSTIDDFRDFFKANKEKEKTTYEELLKMVLNIVETSIVNKNIKLVKNLNSQKVFCTNPNELKQVILNLIKNAEDVLLDRNVENPKITIETNDNVLTISDNGGGIPEDIIDKIFDPYFSTKSKKDGTGLGLYMSKIIIEEHCGGKLSVTNAKEGAVFKVELFD
jgi:signal transduction histidine kinase